MHTNMVSPEPQPTLRLQGVTSMLVTDRRAGTSDLELAAEALQHAISYLVTEQFERRRPPDRANAEAIVLLCQALDGIARVDRRESGRRSIASWLRRTINFRESEPRRARDDDFARSWIPHRSMP